MSHPGASHERVYRALLQLYPEPFRTRFGDELVQLVGDLLRDARDGRPGAGGVLSTWLRILVDVVLTAPAEHQDQGRIARSLDRPPSIALRVLGLLGIAGGVLLVSVWIPFLRFVPETSNIARLLLFNVGAIAIALAVVRGWSSASRLIAPAAVATVVANALTLAMIAASIDRPEYPEPDPEFRLVLDYAMAAMWLSDAALGFVAWRIGPLARWAGLALGFGSILALAGMARLGLFDGDYGWFFLPASQVGIALNGLGWIVLGVVVATRRRQIAAGAAALPSR
jgi:hypothetical protein